MVSARHFVRSVAIALPAVLLSAALAQAAKPTLKLRTPTSIGEGVTFRVSYQARATHRGDKLALQDCFEDCTSQDWFPAQSPKAPPGRVLAVVVSFGAHTASVAAPDIPGDYQYRLIETRPTGKLVTAAYSGITVTGPDPGTQPGA